jgi:hypothetical protein
MLTGVNSLFAGTINDEGKKFNNVDFRCRRRTTTAAWPPRPPSSCPRRASSRSRGKISSKSVSGINSLLLKNFDQLKNKFGANFNSLTLAVSFYQCRQLCLHLQNDLAYQKCVSKFIFSLSPGTKILNPS